MVSGSEADSCGHFDFMFHPLHITDRPGSRSEGVNPQYGHVVSSTEMKPQEAVTHTGNRFLRNASLRPSIKNTST